MIKSIVGIFLILGQSLYAVEGPKALEEMPRSIDHYSEKGVLVEFIELQDPLQIKLKLPDGKTMYVGHIDKDFEALYALENEQEKIGNKLRLLLKYTNRDGVQLYVPKLKKHFKIIGTIEEHPIDLALQECVSEFYSTIGMVECSTLALDAWDAELNRAYKALGGSKNTTLKKAQLAWIKYRDAQKAAFIEEYADSEGTIWRIFIASDILDLTKAQANILKEMNSKTIL